MRKKNTVTADPASPIPGFVGERPDDALPGVALEPLGGWPADEYTGIGGSYVRDPVTGLRSPAAVEPDADVAAGN